MTNATETIIRQTCGLDASIDPESVEGAIDLLRNRAANPIDTPIPPREAARMLKVSTATLRRYVKRNFIRTIGDRKNAKTQTRISRQSVVDFLNGHAA